MTKVIEEKRIVTRGRIWVETKFFDYNGSVVTKSKELLDDYSTLYKWIRKRIPYKAIAFGESVIKGYMSEELMELQLRGYRFTI